MNFGCLPFRVYTVTEPERSSSTASGVKRCHFMLTLKLSFGVSEPLTYTLRIVKYVVSPTMCSFLMVQKKANEGTSYAIMVPIIVYMSALVDVI